MTVDEMLGLLGWSTSQGDAAAAGAQAAEEGQPVSACPWTAPSTLVQPWRAGWVATSAERAAPPTLTEARRSGHVAVVMAAHGSAAALAVRLHADLLGSTGQVG